MGDSMGKVYRDVVNHEYSSQSIECGKDNSSEKKKDYQIAISQDGKFVVTFDTGNDKTTTKHKKSSSGEDEKNDKSKWSLDISNVHKNKKYDSDDSEYFIFVAISRINIDIKQEKDKKDDKKKRDYENGYLSKMQFKPLFDHNDKSVETIISVKPEFKKGIEKGIAIYRLELKNQNEGNEKRENEKKEKKSGEKEKGMKKKYDLSGVTCYYSNNISGICRFIEVSNENDQPS
ncbi:hypothetical protein RhiirA4_416856 [Rhizophagus irregularis]|uniref:Uncharacterized protein n=1 Tax=Rhizophagus irregularis TaxID=588596 RepID=A0A2I1G4Y4_9GLOM|nr:hypothetical protein RhiirA4_416856 [Rhizophagus irregularis]